MPVEILDNIVKPPISDHQKLEELVVTHENLNCKRSLTKRSPDTCTYWRENVLQGIFKVTTYVNHVVSKRSSHTLCTLCVH